MANRLLLLSVDEANTATVALICALAQRNMKKETQSELGLQMKRR